VCLKWYRSCRSVKGAFCCKVPPFEYKKPIALCAIADPLRTCLANNKHTYLKVDSEFIGLGSTRRGFRPYCSPAFRMPSRNFAIGPAVYGTYFSIQAIEISGCNSLSRASSARASPAPESRRAYGLRGFHSCEPSGIVSGQSAGQSAARLYSSTNRSADAHAVLASALRGFSPTPEFPEIAEAQRFSPCLRREPIEGAEGLLLALPGHSFW
jgi:hypothetical protein